MNTQEIISEQVTTNPVVLYMKGTPENPQCGFSAHAVKILDACGASNIFTVDVLPNPEIRQGIKEYSNWPTIPQIFIKGEFIGGCDIVKDMFETGEMRQFLDSNGIETEAQN